MPSKNEIKVYLENSYYHIYNRGVEKRKIFLNDQDYSTFLSYLKNYLLPKNENELQNRLADPNIDYREKNKIIKTLRMNNFNGEVTLLAYCLMPNHFHLLIHQKNAPIIDKFMNSLMTRYSMYFNKKYKRVGPLFQGIYKAGLVKTEEQLLYLTSYIHKQAHFSARGNLLHVSQPSSYPNYLKSICQDWIKPDLVLSFFKKELNNSTADFLSYKSFVEGYQKYEDESQLVINNLCID